MSRRQSFAAPFAVAAVALFGALPLLAQAAPSGGAKPRLELADTVHKAARAEAAPPRKAPRPAPAAPAAKPAVGVPSSDPPAGASFHPGFVRNQTLLGVGIYAPAFAATVAHDGVAWGASYLLVAGGSFVAASEISRRLTITDPMQRLATGAPIRFSSVNAISL